MSPPLHDGGEILRLSDGRALACEVLLWHGEEDAGTPIAVARHVADSLPSCRARFFSGKGHFVVARHWEEIVISLTP